MKRAGLVAGVLCMLAVWAWFLPGVFASAAPAQSGMGALGARGFSDPIIGNGSAADNAPMMLAKKKSKKKKKKKDDEDAGGGSGAVHVDPNTAKLSELMVLPLVDDKVAQAIIAHRPYKSPEDLVNVPEVGPSKYRIFKHLIEIKQPEVSAEMPVATGAEGIEKAP